MGNLVRTLIDFLGMCAAGVMFVGGLYLVYIRKLTILAVFMVAVALMTALFLNSYELIIEDDEEEELQEAVG